MYTKMCISVYDKCAIHSGKVKIYSCNYFFIVFFLPTAIIHITNLSPPLKKQYHLHPPLSKKVHKLL